MVRWRRLAASLGWVSVAGLAMVASAQTGGKSMAQPRMSSWTASWGASVQGPEGSNQASGAPSNLADMTVRQVVPLSLGGAMIRVQFSNAFGTRPLLIDAAAVALAPAPGTDALVPGSSRPVLFSGQPGVLIPVGATYLSDPVALAVPARSNLAISFHLPEAPSVETTHPGSRATSYLAPGNHVADPTLPGAEKVVRWMQLAEVDVVHSGSSAVVALGDSITDGHAANTDANQRWTDSFSAHLASAGLSGVGVVNEGIGGNHLLTNGIGQSALERFDRDVLGVAGVHAVIVTEGINDLGALSRSPDATPAMHTALVGRIEAAFVQIVERAHAHGIRVYGATITPDDGSDYYHPAAADDAARHAINDWIRQPGHFDGVVDFDQLLRDPAHPNQLLPAFDSGDHLHPGPAGYKAMGEAIPLSWFR